MLLQLTFFTSVVSQSETKTCMMSYHQHECHGDVQQQVASVVILICFA